MPPVAGTAGFHFGQQACCLGLHVVVIDPEPASAFVEHDGAVFVYRADREFRVAWRADLLDQDDVEIRSKLVSECARHRHRAPGDAEHQRPLAAKPGQCPGQPAGGFGAILERKLDHCHVSQPDTRCPQVEPKPPAGPRIDLRQSWSSRLRPAFTTPGPRLAPGRSSPHVGTLALQATP